MVLCIDPRRISISKSCVLFHKVFSNIYFDVKSLKIFVEGVDIFLLKVCRYRKCLEVGMKPDKVDAGWSKRLPSEQDEVTNEISDEVRRKTKIVRKDSPVIIKKEDNGTALFESRQHLGQLLDRLFKYVTN